MWNAGSAKQPVPLSAQGVHLEMAQRQINNKDEDLQCCHHHHLAVRFRMLDISGDRLDETGGFPDELPSSYPWGDPM